MFSWYIFDLKYLTLYYPSPFEQFCLCTWKREVRISGLHQVTINTLNSGRIRISKHYNRPHWLCDEAGKNSKLTYLLLKYDKLI
jgi:hypothetical protein